MFTTGLLPSNNNPLADAVYYYVSLVNIGVDFVGIIFNVINVIMFTKQKTSESINVTLLGLAVSDLFSLFASLLNSAFINPLFIQNEVPVEPLEVMYVLSGMPRLCFSRVSMWLVLFASLERCLCVAMPLKVKVIVTKTRAQTFVVCSFVLAFVLFSPVFVSTQLTWKFSKPRNRTLIGIVLESDFVHIQDVIAVTIGVVTFASFALLVTLTVILIVRLNQKSKWRSQHSSIGNEPFSASRDQKLVKMIVTIDMILITCYFPSVVISLLSFTVTEFAFLGKLENAFFISWKAAFLLESINSSINIFVYYNMSSKFKVGMRMMFPFLAKNQQESGY